jgi:hypothetical protein
MERPDDRITRQLAEVREKIAALDREEAERRAEAEASAVVDRRKGGALRSTVFFIGLVLAIFGLGGLAITFSRLSGDDFDDARREGSAQVISCDRQGPITTKGFGYWQRCTTTVTWDEGGTDDRIVVDLAFRSTDVGKQVRVGDLGEYRYQQELVRADAPYRPWLLWIGILVGIIAFVPTLIVVLIVQSTFHLLGR